MKGDNMNFCKRTSCCLDTIVSFKIVPISVYPVGAAPLKINPKKIRPRKKERLCH